MANYGAESSGDCSGSMARTIFDRYTEYVGTIIAPKSLYPAAVYVSRDSSRFFVFTPNRKYLLGGGYYGDTDGPEDATRQHMLPGLCRADDRGAGIGTSLYLAGNMVNAAKYQDRGDDRLQGLNRVYRAATYSKSDDRSAAADRAWMALNDNQLSETEPGGYVSLYVETDIDNLVDSDTAEQIVRDYYQGSDEDPGDSEIEIDSISGTATIEGSWEGGETDVMEWDTVKDSGLVLHLSDLFDDPNDHAAVPPGVFGRLDWSQTPMSKIVEFAEQNAVIAGLDAGPPMAVGEHDEEAARQWVREAAQAARESGWSAVAETLLDRIGEGSQMHLPGTEPPALTGNPGVSRRFDKLSREWADVYGPHTDWA